MRRNRNIRRRAGTDLAFLLIAVLTCSCGTGGEGDTAARGEAAASAFANKQFLSALHLAPEQFPLLHGVDAPSIDIGERGEMKSGGAGTGRLDLAATVLAAAASDRQDIFAARANILSLFSGMPPAAAMIGSGSMRLYRPTTRLDAGVEPSIGWTREDNVSPFVEIGTTPLGGAVAPTVAGRVGAKVFFENGEFDAEARREAVTESILSYTGIVDPATGHQFGRVVETGGKVGYRRDFTENWSAQAALSAGIRSGQAVADNGRVAAEAGLSYNFTVPGFDELSLGPVYGFEHFARNQNFYTVGNGGYYSPQAAHRFGLDLEFLTAELRDLMVQGSVSPGWQVAREDAALLSFDGAQPVPGRTRYGADFSSEVRAAYRLGAYWSLAAVLQAEVSPQFDDFFAGLALKYSFAPRAALTSRDIPISPTRRF